MPTRILGISAFYHDSAAALVVDGRVVAAAQEERFTRVKHDHRFPEQAVAYCLKEAGISASDLDHVVFYEKPFLKFERLLETHLAAAPAGFRSFVQALPLWVHEKLRLPSVLNRALGGAYRRPYVFTEHHEAHAASAFFPSPFEEAAIVVMDGVGEWATGSIGHGRGNRIELSKEMRFPHSLGLLYSAFTYFCGFRVNSGEYKLMGLAPYGRPVYESLILETLVDLRQDGSFRLDLEYFNYCAGLTMTSSKFDALFGGPPRDFESPLTQRELDLAASIQKVTETIVLKTAAHAHALTASRNLCMAGGVALNCVANGRLLREGPFERIWVQPAAGDSGGALGAALFAWHQLLEKPRVPERPDAQKGSLLGPEYSDSAVTESLAACGAVFRVAPTEEALAEEIAQALADSQVVGWMQGRMEFGPRALGGRSILGDARSPRMQSIMNLKIKFRESFRPFAPIVLAEKASEYFDLKPGQDSPYMLMVADVRADKRTQVDAQKPMSLGRVNEVRSVIPAVTHVDHSARIQTVDRETNPRLRRLMEAFDRKTGCPVLINTSYNVRGEPIICSPEDAYRCFLATGIDVLVVGRAILRKAEQPEGQKAAAAGHTSRFGQD